MERPSILIEPILASGGFVLLQGSVCCSRILHCTRSQRREIPSRQSSSSLIGRAVVWPMCLSSDVQNDNNLLQLSQEPPASHLNPITIMREFLFAAMRAFSATS